MNGAAATLPERVLRWFVPRLSPETRPWGEAMLGELDAVRGRVERLLWALGGATVMMRMLLRQWMRPGAAWFSSADPVSGGSRPPRRWRPAALIVLSLVLLLLPDVRQGIRVVIASFTWRRAMSQPMLVDHVAARARQHRNARLLAAAALQTSDLELRGRWADEAIAMDPSLTWIEYPVARSEVVFGDVRSPATRAYKADAERRAAVLQTWDPDNAIPYLLAAEIAGVPPGNDRVELHFYSPFGGAVTIREGRAGTVPSSAWRDAMEKAFAAHHYDTYLDRRFLLMRDTLGEFGNADPVRLIVSMSSHPVPNMMGLRRYSNLLLGDAAFARGRIGTPLPPGTADPKRIPQYWQVALFGERMQLEGGSEVDRLIGVSLQTNAYRPLQQALQETGRTAEADAIGFRLRQLDNAAHDSWVRNVGRDPGRKAQRDLYRWFALAADAASVVAALCVLLLLVGLLFAAERRLRRRPVGRALAAVFRHAPVILCSACVVLYLCYLPYAQAFRGYLSAPDVPDLRGFYEIFGAFFDTPLQTWLGTAQQAYYGWWALLGSLTLLLGWRVLHLVGHWHAI